MHWYVKKNLFFIDSTGYETQIFYDSYQTLLTFGKCIFLHTILYSTYNS